MEAEKQKTARLVLEHLQEIERLRTEYPDIACQVDEFRESLRQLLMDIQKQIGLFPEHDRDLVAVLVVNGIHKMTDEIFLAGGPQEVV